MAKQTEPAPTGYVTFIWLAWYSAFAAVRRHLLLFTGSIVIVALAKFGADFLGNLLAHVENSFLQGFLNLLVTLASMAAQALAVAPIAIAVHRLVILSGDIDGVLHRRVWRFALWLIGIWLFNGLSSLPPLIFGQSGSIVLVVMIVVAVAVVSLRTALIFPALATDVPAETAKERIEGSWRQTHGHFWRLFLVSVGAGLPVAFLGLLVNGVAKRVLGTAEAAVGSLLVTDLIRGILATVAVAVGAGVASWIYLWALDHPYQAPAQPDDRSPAF